MIKNKKLSLLIGLSLSGLLLAACGKPKEATKTLSWSEISELQSLDAAMATDVTSSEIIRNSFEGLYRLDGKGQVQKGLAQKVFVSKDRLTYTFNLRKDAKWSNGDPVTAQDFVYGWQRMVNPKTASPNTQLFQEVKNANDIVAGKKAPSALGIKAEGKYKLVVTLDSQVPYLKNLLCTPIFYPVNQKAVEKYGKKYGTSAKTIVYNGPFQVRNWTGTSTKWALVKNKNYWGANDVKLSKISFMVTKSTTTSYNLFQNGKLDQTQLTNQQAQNLKANKEFHAYKQARVQYLQFNEQNQYLQNENIRRAISYAIDRQTLAKKILGDGSLASHVFTSEDLASYKGKDFTKDTNNTASTHNLKKAKAAWQAGLAQLGTDKITLNMMGYDDVVTKNVLEYVQSQLETNLSGLTVNINSIPKATAISRYSDGNFDFGLLGWGADYADPTTFLNLYTSDGSSNYGKWKSQAYDDLMKAAKTTDVNNQAKRWDDLVKAADILNQEQAISPLYQPTLATMVKSKVQNVGYDNFGHFIFRDMDVK